MSSYLKSLKNQSKKVNNLINTSRASFSSFSNSLVKTKNRKNTCTNISISKCFYNHQLKGIFEILTTQEYLFNRRKSKIDISIKSTKLSPLKPSKLILLYHTIFN